MPRQNFFLVGSESDHVTLDISGTEDLEDLKRDLASAFSICNPKTVSFHDAQGTAELASAKSILDHSGLVGIKVSGNAVRSPYGPRELPFVGHHFQLYPDYLGNIDRLFERYGSVIKTVNMGTTTYLTNDPLVSEAVLSESPYFTKTTSDPGHPLFFMQNQTALFTCDTTSPAFKVSHKFVPPSLAPRAVRCYIGIMQRAIEQSYGVFDELDANGKAFNVYQYMFKMAGQIIYRVVLGLDVGHFTTMDTRPHRIIVLLGEYMQLMKKTSLQPRWYRYLPFGEHRRVGEMRQRIFALIQRAMDEAPIAEDGGADLPMHEAAVRASCVADYLRRAVDEEGNKLPKEYRLSNTVSLVGAGFVTSASLLSWLLYSLTHYPGHQERLLQELVDHAPPPDEAWDYDVVTSLPFLDSFVKETHRMHNPSFQTARNVKADVVLPGGWLVPAGSIVIPPFPSLHKSPDQWENPGRFDPDRWLDGRDQPRRHRMAYTPFAAGPRGCIGYTLATLEAKLCIANLVHRYEFVDASREPVEYDPEFLVIRPLNFYVRARRRSNWPPKSASTAS
ncbi:hypothetical protein PgNI_06636 [Pyricularia grisea]|uniref:Uncharacterized protein n=1 Tax=Pyricularia grisea TaxID=148305 RepID=A0A6P8B6Q3_PYRGI|nr:hypothetical protein PgNI_06636 [Pyricularia grisea]TLD10804.1 hypothetical protein PgNI_06636 [Pyricularia grisea]